MKTIPIREITYTELAEIFIRKQLHAEVLPSEGEYLAVTYPDKETISVWRSQTEEGMLRMRAIVYDYEKVDLLENKAKNKKFDLGWEKMIANANQNGQAFGALNLNFGLVIDYKIPFHTEILEETILLACENLVRSLKVCRHDLNNLIKEMESASARD